MTRLNTIGNIPENSEILLPPGVEIQRRPTDLLTGGVYPDDLYGYELPPFNEFEKNVLALSRFIVNVARTGIANGRKTEMPTELIRTLESLQKIAQRLDRKMIRLGYDLLIEAQIAPKLGDVIKTSEVKTERRIHLTETHGLDVKSLEERTDPRIRSQTLLLVGDTHPDLLLPQELKGDDGSYSSACAVARLRELGFQVIVFGVQRHLVDREDRKYAELNGIQIIYSDVSIPQLINKAICSAHGISNVGFCIDLDLLSRPPERNLRGISATQYCSAALFTTFLHANWAMIHKVIEARPNEIQDYKQMVNIVCSLLLPSYNTIGALEDKYAKALLEKGETPKYNIASTGMLSLGLPLDVLLKIIKKVKESLPDHIQFGIPFKDDSSGHTITEVGFNMPDVQGNTADAIDKTIRELLGLQ